MKRVFAMMGVLLVALVALLPSTARAQATDPELIMDAWIAVPVDPDTKLQLVADNVTMRIDLALPVSARVWTGKAQAHSYVTFSQRQLLSSQLMGSWKVSGNRISGTVLLRTRTFEALGVGPVKHLYTAGIERGKIAWLAATVAPSELPRLAAARRAARQGISRLTAPLDGTAKPKGWGSTGMFPPHVMH